jgi:hypothetical protein
MDRDELHQQAEDGGRIVRRADLLATGIPPSSLHDALRGDGWQREHRGLYVPPHVAMEPSLRARAALVSVGDGACLARASVLWLRELLEEAPRNVQLIVPDRRQPARRRDVDVVRSRTLRADEITVVEGMRATTLARAVRDCCASGWTVEQLLPLSLTALQQRKLWIADLREQRRRMGRGCRGGDTLDTLIAELERDGSDSILERLGRDGLGRRNLRPEPAPFPWRAPDGVVDHLDIAFPDAWVCVFCDGRAHHGTGPAFSSDRRMWNQVAGLWRPFWFDAATARDGSDDFTDEVARAVAEADPTRPRARRHPCRCSRCLARER